MRMSHVVWVALAVLGSSLCCSGAWAQGPGDKDKAKVRVGTFDSRAVAVAYARSKEFNQHIRQLMEEQKKAKEAGDQEKVKNLEAQGKAQQQRFHEQGFSTASVDDILARIKDKLPEIAKEAGVDLIVSKWDVAFKAPGAETVDITELVIKPFQPDEKVLRIIKDLKDKAPIPLEELRKQKDI